MRKLDKVPIDKIREIYYKPNVTLPDAAKELGVNTETLRLFLQVNNVPRKNPGFDSAIPKSDKQKIHDLYWKENKSTIEIGKLYNLEHHAVINYMRNNKIPIRSCIYTNIPEADKETIQEMYNEYNAIEPIAKKYNCTDNTVIKYMDKYGLDRKNKVSRYNFTKAQINDMVKMYDSGKFIHDISKKYNCTPPTIIKTFKDNNITIISSSIRNKEKSKDPVFLKKVMKSLWHQKEYILPSGKKINLMGYEPQFLDFIFTNKLLKETEIAYEVEPIPYIKNGGEHRYIPDFYIPKLNLIVEIKSCYILEKQGDQFDKEQGTKLAGYNYCLVLDNNFNHIKSLLNSK